jgi:hypothetical protein
MNKIAVFFLLLMSFSIYASQRPTGGIKGSSGILWRRLLYKNRLIDVEIEDMTDRVESDVVSIKKSSSGTITLEQWRASKLSDDSGSKQTSSSFDSLGDSKASSEVADDVKAFLMKEGDEV